jgi:hypothetical protein
MALRDDFVIIKHNWGRIMPMDAQLKARVRAELFRCAFAGQFPTYAQFFDRIHPGKTMGQFPYKAHFNKIAEEERDQGYPDITFIVRGKDGYPHQIDFSEVGEDGPDPKQLASLRKGTAEIIKLYCPANTQSPY